MTVQVPDVIDYADERKDSANDLSRLPTPITKSTEPGNDVDIQDIRDGGSPLDLTDSIREGLRLPEGSRELPSLLLWNENGLKYFEEITYVPEYYLTNAEISLLEAHCHQIAHRIPSGAIILELGSGNLRKVNILLKAIDVLGKHVDYYALDLDRDELVRTLRQVGPSTFQNVRCHGLLGTYEDGQDWLSRPENVRRPRCVLSLGSTIGSMTRPEAGDFWQAWANTLLSAGTRNDIYVVMGIDACKDKDQVFCAYNDREGANRRFIMNALDQANEQLGRPSFNLEDWTVQGEWDAEVGTHNQYFVPLKDVTVEGVSLRKGEKVFVVSSHKYDDAEKARLWKDSGLSELERYMTKHGSYGLHILSPTAQDGVDSKL